MRTVNDIIDGFDEDSEEVIDALIEYLQEIKAGQHEEHAILLDAVLSHAIHCAFEKRFKPINVLINSAIRRKAKK